MGLAAKSAHQVYEQILNYLALVAPAQALKTVLFTFNQTTAAATSGKVTLGSFGTIWAASVGISAIQSALNAIYKIHESRGYIVSQLYAIWLTFDLAIVVSIGLAALFAGNSLAGMAHGYFHCSIVDYAAAALVRLIGWRIAALMLSLTFALIYYWGAGMENAPLAMAHARWNRRDRRLAC